MPARRVLRVEPRRVGDGLHAVEHLRDLVETHRAPVPVGDDDLLELLGVVQLTLRDDVEGVLRAEQLPGRQVDVPVLQRRVNFVDADLLRLEPRRIDLDAN